MHIYATPKCVQDIDYREQLSPLYLRGSITVRIVSRLTGFDSTKQNNFVYYSFEVNQLNPKQVKLWSSRTMIPPPIPLNIAIFTTN